MKEKVHSVVNLKRLVTGVVLINLLVTALAGIAIYRSRLQYEERAGIITQNVSQVLTEYMNGVMTKIDVTLLSVVDEAEKQLTSGGINRKALDSYIARQYAHIPEFEALRMADEKGDVICGVNVAPGINIADRDNFIHLRNDSKGEMLIPRPVFGRIAKKLVINIARRVNKPDGSFAGVVFGTLSLENLTKKLSGINLGKQMSIIVLNAERYVIARYPEPKGIGNPVGTQVGSPEFLKLFEEGRTAATYTAHSSVDGVERLFSYRKIAGYPVYIDVGLAKDDYLSEWRKQSAQMSALVALFSLVVLCLAYLLHRYITDSKKAEMVLRESEAKFKTMVETLPLAIYLNVGIEQIGEYINSTFTKLFGYTLEEIPAVSKWWPLAYPDETYRTQILEEWTSRVKRALETQSPIEPMEVIVTCKDGSKKNILWGYIPMGDKNYAYGLDLSKGKEAEEKIRQLVKEQQIILNTLATGVMYTSQRKVVWANDAFRTIFGYSKSESDGLDARKLYADVKDYERVGREGYACVAKGETYSTEVLGRKKDGSTFWVNISGRAVDADDALKGVISAIQDINDRKMAEEELLKTHRLLRSISESSTDVIYVKDLHGRYLLFNKEAARATGKKPEEVLGTNDYVLFPADEADTVMDRDRKVMESGKVMTYEEVLTTPDGIVTYLSSKGPIYNEKSEVVGLFGIARNITERKLAETKIMESEKLIRNILDTVDEGFIVVDRNFRILLANKTYCSHLNSTDDKVVGRHCYEVTHKSLRPCFEEGEDCAVSHVFATGEPGNSIHRHQDPKGDILYVETKAFPIMDSSGAITSVIETIQDITEKYLLEEERLKTQKLEAIGTLAGGIAHDFNNLLQGVFGYISMTKMTFDDKERSLAMLDQAEKALHMSVNLTTQLLTFSKGGKPVKKKVTLQPVIENSVRFALSGSRADYRIKFDSDLWQVEADEGQIGQVIQNIVLNADQAMPVGGTIVITAKNVQASKKKIPQISEEDKYVEISIKDNGIGISKESITKIFDPYFTTKVKGSGLGLATCYSIIKNHRGVINVSSKVGRGTTFYIYLPAIEPEKEDRQSSELSPFARKGKILVMDDEELIRDLAGEMIEALGHKVELAEHGEEAIRKYEAAMESGNPFDIVILDLTIRGGMGGRETIERLFSVNPKIKAIVSSGYSYDNAVSDYHNYGFCARLTKPYKLQELSDTLNKLMSQ
jgi:PAS domain S-box-containing protein